MSLPQTFLGWMHNRFSQDANYRRILPTEDPWVGQFDLCFARSGSLAKGNQTQLYKIIPSNLTIEQARGLAMLRDQVVGSKSSIFKLLQDFLVFFYVTDAPIARDTLRCLADFAGVQKSVLGNVSVLCFLLETAGGTYLMPQRSGYFGWLPIKKLREEIQRDILEPFRVWRQQQQQTRQP